MKTPTMHDKILELYIKRDDPDTAAISRTVEKYLRHRYSDKKIQKIVTDMLNKYNFKEAAAEVRRRNKLSIYIDSMVISRIRDSYKSSNIFNIDELDELKFKVLVKQVVLYFGYEVLFVPRNSLSSLDIIVHRGDTKVAVLAVKCASGFNASVRSVRQIRYMANHYNCEQALLISSSSFDAEAVEEARNMGVTLLDKDKFLPLVHDLIENRHEEEKQLLISSLAENKDAIFLEGHIKSPKTKVQVSFIKYYVQSGSHNLVFEGELYNSGKRPVSNLEIIIKVFNRDGDCVFQKSSPANNTKLSSKDSTMFKIVFNEVMQSDWKNICRYELKLEYNNVFAAE